MPLPTYDDVLAAAARIAPHAHATPVLRSRALDALAGCELHFKAEPLQRTGAFKFRGAYNRISRLTDAEKARGVVAFSSGNHAQGVAAAAAMVGTPAIIVMPSDSPRVKVEGVIGFGGEVRFYDRWTESREAIGAAIAAERGSILVPPFDDPFIIEGQGTTALEMLDQADAPFDQLLCGASGGGLMAGINLVMAERSPLTKVFVVEPEAFDDTARSLAAGERVGHPQGAPSICDALMSPMPGVLTWPINRRLAGAITVSDGEVAEAVRFAFRHLKIVLDAGGAVSLAALLAGKIETKGRTTAIVLSGGNVDPTLYAEIIEGRFSG